MAQALLRTIDKLFHDQSVGLGEELRQFLRGNVLGGSYDRWVGNKFNILFNNARLAYLYHDQIITFLTKVHKSKNRAAQAVLNMLKSRVCVPEYGLPWTTLQVLDNTLDERCRQGWQHTHTEL